MAQLRGAGAAWKPVGGAGAAQAIRVEVEEVHVVVQLAAAALATTDDELPQVWVVPDAHIHQQWGGGARG